MLPAKVKCLSCKNFYKDKAGWFSCEAYPDGIPDEIIYKGSEKACGKLKFELVKKMDESTRYVGIGAIIGDIVGSPYEFDQGNKTEDFPLFTASSRPTDDTVMTLAVAEGLVRAAGQSREAAKVSIIESMVAWGLAYPQAGYGARFSHWLHDPKPYGSYGNGSAMRVSSVGWLFDNIEDVLAYAKLTAEVSHNHPEGIKGAQTTAAAIFLTRNGMEKRELRDYIQREFGYDLSRTLADIRPAYRHVESCQQTVPEAITAYLEGESFEDVLRKAVSLGGDADTLTAIAASIAEAKYTIPDWIYNAALIRLDNKMQEAFSAYNDYLLNR